MRKMFVLFVLFVTSILTFQNVLACSVSSFDFESFHYSCMVDQSTIDQFATLPDFTINKITNNVRDNLKSRAAWNFVVASFGVSAKFPEDSLAGAWGTFGGNMGMEPVFLGQVNTDLSTMYFGSVAPICAITVKIDDKYYVFFADDLTSSFMLGQFDTSIFGNNWTDISLYTRCCSTKCSNNPVPIPGTFVLFGFGLMGISLVRKKKN